MPKYLKLILFLQNYTIFFKNFMIKLRNFIIKRGVSMKFFASKLLVSVLIVFSFSSLMADSSCQDLKSNVRTLDELAVALSDTGEIAEASELDKALGEVVEALQLLADTEEDQALYASVIMLTDSWENNDWTQFKIALDSTTNNINRIYAKGCR